MDPARGSARHRGAGYGAAMPVWPCARAGRAAAAIAALALLPWAAAANEPTAPPSILLVTFDTTRADRIGAYGYPQPVTPTLDRLASEGVLFESAIAPTPMTLPSHVSMLAGVTPPQHGVHDNAIFVLDPRATLVSEVLQRRGWRTGAFIGTFMLDARFGLDQGFDTYRGPQVSRLAGAGHVERPANEVVDDAVAWLRTLEPGERFFAWVHLLRPPPRLRPARALRPPLRASLRRGDRLLRRPAGSAAGLSRAARALGQPPHRGDGRPRRGAR